MNSLESLVQSFKKTPGGGTRLAEMAAVAVMGNRGGVIFDEAGVARPVKRAMANIAANQTDGAIVTAVDGKMLRVISVVALCGGTATTLTFNSKPAGSGGTAISPLLANAANGGEVLPRNVDGWFQTKLGEGLTAATSNAAATGILVSYIEVPSYATGDDGLVLFDANGAQLLVPDGP